MKAKAIIPICVAVGLLLIIMIACPKEKVLVVSSSPVSTPVSSKKPVIKVFLENSGSMDGYMCDGSQLKDAIYDYVSDLNRVANSTKLYYINSQIINFNGDITSYVKNLNPKTFSQAGGNRSNSDLGKVLDTVLGTVDKNTVAVFISDCILDLPSNNAQKFLTTCEIQIKNDIIKTQKRVPNLAVEILKLSSDFDGKYFYPNGSVEELKNVKRPYYIWIFGDKNILAKLNSEVSLSMLYKYNLDGIVAFTNKGDVPFEIKNRALTGNAMKSQRGEYKATIFANMSGTLQPDEEVLDKNNYSFNSKEIKIEGISVINDKNSKYTHFFNISIPDNVVLTQESLSFNAPKLPYWVEATNDETGTNVKKNISKTTGIKYLIQGVADAYRNEEIVTMFNFNMKRK